jgi:hypothetical protein
VKGVLTQRAVCRARPHAFYVTIRNGHGQTIFALGPFRRHRRALGLTDLVRLRVLRADLDRWCDYGYGTSSMPIRADLPVGVFNDALNIGPDPGLRTGRAQRVPQEIIDRLAGVAA